MGEHVHDDVGAESFGKPAFRVRHMTSYATCFNGLPKSFSDGKAGFCSGIWSVRQISTLWSHFLSRNAGPGLVGDGFD